MESRCDRAGIPVIQTAEPTAFGGLGHGFFGTGKIGGVSFGAQRRRSTSALMTRNDGLGERYGYSMHIRRHQIEQCIR